MMQRFIFTSLRMVFLCSALLLLLPVNVLGQTTPVSNPNAVSLASKVLQAMVGGTAALTDITLQSNANYIVGSDQESGTATLVARSDGESLVTLNLSGGQRREIRDGLQGAWVGIDGTAHYMATHNCLVDADWFYPALSLAASASDPSLIMTLVGQEVRAGEPVYHLTIFHYLSGQQPPGQVALIEQLSAMDLYLDATSLMPAAVDFNIHPDQDAMVNIPVEIRFGAYQSFNGTWAPTRIQQYIQNSLTLDLTVISAVANSGITDSFFTLPYVATGGGL
jgi:hypothetical protein